MRFVASGKPVVRGVSTASTINRCAGAQLAGATPLTAQLSQVRYTGGTQVMVMFVFCGLVVQAGFTPASQKPTST